MAVPPLHCGVTGALYSIRGLVELSAAERYTTRRCISGANAGGFKSAGMTKANGGWHGRMRPSCSASNSAVRCPLERRATTCGSPRNAPH